MNSASSTDDGNFRLNTQTEGIGTFSVKWRSYTKKIPLISSKISPLQQVCVKDHFLSSRTLYSFLFAGLGTAKNKEELHWLFLVVEVLFQIRRDKIEDMQDGIG